jgi:hypothetical protein
VGGVLRRVAFPDNAAWGEDLREVGDFVGADGDVGSGEILQPALLV